MLLHAIVYFSTLFYSITESQAAVHQPQHFLKSIQASPNEGELIYRHFCSNCHAEKPLIMLGAPRIQQEEDWKNRLKQGMDTLFQHSDEGINAMPPRGGCFECTDEQLMKAIQFLIPPSSKNQ